MKTYKGLVTSLLPNEIFVFGSNPQGIHGAGAARVAATKYYAIYGVGRGIQGNSYALITKNLEPDYFEGNRGIVYPTAGPRSVSEEQIIDNIKELYGYAVDNPENDFMIAYTPYGSLLNGYTIQEMADMFSAMDIPENIIFNVDFAKLLKI